jgi:high-affinity K+ transport system ATPase subunit B
MHLERGLSTVNTKNPKQKKLTKADQQRLYSEWRKFNKDMRRKHMHDFQFATFEAYVAYTRGKSTGTSTRSQFKEYRPSHRYTRGTTDHIPSHGLGVGTATKKEQQVYTGDLIEGIATMHKSNAVPVMKGTNEAKDISRMRRG